MSGQKTSTKALFTGDAKTLESIGKPATTAFLKDVVKTPDIKPTPIIVKKSDPNKPTEIPKTPVIVKKSDQNKPTEALIKMLDSAPPAPAKKPRKRGPEEMNMAISFEVARHLKYLCENNMLTKPQAEAMIQATKQTEPAPQVIVQATKPPEPAPQAIVQAPKQTEPPPQAIVQAPKQTEPPPQAIVQAPKQTEPAPQAIVQAPKPPDPAPQAIVQEPRVAPIQTPTRPKNGRFF